MYNAVYGQPDQTYPALVSIPVGEGSILYATTALSNFDRGRYKLKARWEKLMSNLVLSLLSQQAQDFHERFHISLRAYTTPREWVAPGEPVRLVVNTEAGTAVTAVLSGGEAVTLNEVQPGYYQSPDLALAAGQYRFTVTAGKGEAQRTVQVRLDIKDRQAKYLEMVSRNTQWYFNSGVMRGANDGTKGVGEGFASEINYLGENPLRTGIRGDCNVESA